jgi:hypothetical protein
MTLSYSLRLFCLLTVAAGVVCAALQAALSCCAGFLLRQLHAAASRRRERILFLIQIAPTLLAIFVAGALCFPEYLRHEPARATEPVGWIPLLIAASVCLWFGAALIRGLRTTLRSLRFAGACRDSGRLIPPIQGPPLLAAPQPVPPLALVGFFRPFIVISEKLLDSGRLDPEALQVALDHERAHHHHFDNWKMLFLCFLPRLPGDPWLREWRSAADWAADEDASRGDLARSLLLAEAVVRTAGLVRHSAPDVICAALTSADTALAVRVDRLLHPPSASRSAERSLVPTLAGLVLLTILSAAIASPWIYGASEYILHLGGF